MPLDAELQAMLRIRHSGNIRVKERESSMILPDLFMGEIGSGVHTPNKPINGSQKFGTMAAD